MKKYNLIAFIVLLLVSWGCQQPDTFEKSGNMMISNIQATLSDGSGSFVAEGEAPYGDTIKIVIPYNYPEESSNVTPVNALIVKATLPNSTVVSPKLGLMDLTHPIDIYVTASNGDVKHHILKADIRKNAKATIEKFTLSSGLDGAINETEKKIYLISLDDIGTQTATVKLAPHATISPDPSLPLDYSKAQTFTVTSQNGKKAVYTVEKGIPNKAPSGFTATKVLWQKSLKELYGYSDYHQIGIAVSGEHLVIPISNEWAATTEIPYYSTKNASYEGSLNVTGLSGAIFQVANDSKGHILANTMAWAYGPDLNIWKWNDVKATPEKFITWSPLASGITFDNDAAVGRKLSIQGDLEGDAMIYSTVGNSNVVVRWTVKGGVLESQTPEIINTGLPVWSYVTKAEATGNYKTDDYVLCGNGLKPSLFNGTTKKGTFSTGLVRNFSFASKSFIFNNAKYLSIADSDDATASGKCYIFDVTGKFPVAKVFESESILAGTANANATGDIAVGPVSTNGFTMTVYCMITNSSIVAYELNCMEIKK